MKRFILIAAMALTVISCGSKKQKPMTADELYNECATGVVMVLNHYYVELTLPTGEVFYWVENQNDTIFTDGKKIVEYCDSKMGTGFFVSENGKIVTDMNIADPAIDGAKLKAVFEEFFKWNSDRVTEGLQSTAEELKKVQTRIASAEFWSQAPSKTDTDERDRLNAAYVELEAQQAMWQGMKFSDFKTKIVSDLRIAYNKTIITNLSDLEEAELLEPQEGEQWATIQLKSRAPIPNTHIFDANYEGKPEVGHPVYMIYFSGEYDSLTPIKAKLATGMATANAVEVGVVQYSLPIPAILGAPILDEFGNLISK